MDWHPTCGPNHLGLGLQVNSMGLANEKVGENGYGMILIGLTLVLLPISLAFVAQSIADVRSERVRRP